MNVSTGPPATDSSNGFPVPPTQAPPRRDAANPAIHIPPAFIGLGLVLLFTTFIRLRVANTPLERDEGEFAYGGQLLLQGVAPIEHLYAMKLPGIYAAYGLLMSVFGQSGWGVHVGALCVNLATIALLFFLSRRWFDTLTATIAAATYALLALMPEVLGFAAHATHFVVAFVFAGALALTRTLDRAPVSPPARTRLGILASGLLFGLAILMKQPGVVFVPLGFVALWRYDLSHEPQAGRPVRLGGRFALLALGATVPVAVTWGLLAVKGDLTRALFWNVTYAREYGSLVTPYIGWLLFLEQWRAMSAPFIAFLLLGITGTIVSLWDKTARSNAVFAGSLLLLGALAVVPGFYFRPHYFVLLLPGIALGMGLLCAGAGRGATIRVRQDGRRGALAIMIAVFLFAIPALSLMITHGRVLFTASPIEVDRSYYKQNLFPESVPIADYVRRHTDPNETIAVFGSEPQIYFLSGRRSATGYIYMYPLMEPQRYAHEMQEEMAREVTQSHPRYVVLVSGMASWVNLPQSDTFILNWINDYRKDFDVVAVTDQRLVKGNLQAVYYWDADAAHYKPRSSHFLAVLRRRDTKELDGNDASPKVKR